MKKKIAIIIGIVVFSGLLIRYMAVARFLTTSNEDVIHNNIYINGVAVGNMSVDEAHKTLQSLMELDKKIINFAYNNSLVYSYTFADFGAKYDFTALIEEAFAHGRRGSMRERYAALRRLENNAHNIIGEPKYYYDEASIPERLELVRSQASILPVNASMRIEAEQFIVTEGKPGRTPDIQKAIKQVKELLANKQSGQVVLEMHQIKPSYTVEHFSISQSLLGYFESQYQGGDDSSRAVNIRLAAASINNTVVLPGEIFSTSSAIGPSTPERGYRAASVIIDGRLVDDYGGGVCQLASTLYNALLFAELAIVERANHSIQVHYMQAGFDAAIAGDYMDLRFKNNSKYPVLIAAAAQNGIIEVRIYGHETRPENRSLTFVSERIEVIPPEPDKILTDENLPSGHVLVNTEPRNGYKYELYKVVFVDGQQVAKERVNTSIYRPVQGIISRGP